MPSPYCPLPSIIAQGGVFLFSIEYSQHIIYRRGFLMQKGQSSDTCLHACKEKSLFPTRRESTLSLVMLQEASESR